MEEAAELADYLPLSFKTSKEQEYIEFRGDAFETNHTHGKIQFPFLPYHMLTMSFVYFNIWQIKQTVPNDFEKGLIGFGKDIEKSLLGATSPFVFSSVNERTMLRCYSNFLVESYDQEEREYSDDVDQIREVLIHENYLSQKDIELCAAFNISEH